MNLRGQIRGSHPARRISGPCGSEPFSGQALTLWLDTSPQEEQGQGWAAHTSPVAPFGADVPCGSPPEPVPRSGCVGPGAEGGSPFTSGSARPCTAAAPGRLLSGQDRKKKNISAKPRLGLCLKPLSKEPCLNVIAPLLLQGENTLHCSLFLGKLG